jgi:hypothetical protein
MLTWLHEHFCVINRDDVDVCSNNLDDIKFDVIICILIVFAGFDIF